MQVDQVNGDQEKIPANQDSSVEINATDAHLVHAEIESRSFDPGTGVKTSVPIIQSFYQHEFDSMEKANAFSGKSVRIVHTPEKYVAKDIASVDPHVQAGGNQGTGPAPVVNATPPIITGGDTPATNGGLDLSGALNAANAQNAADAEKDGNAERGKPVSRMTKPELIVKYKELYGEDPQDMTNPELVSAINDKLDDIEALKKSAEENQQ